MHLKSRLMLQAQNQRLK